jgi:hypothetical protein
MEDVKSQGLRTWLSKLREEENDLKYREHPNEKHRIKDRVRDRELGDRDPIEELLGELGDLFRDSRYSRAGERCGEQGVLANNKNKDTTMDTTMSPKKQEKLSSKEKC